MVNYSIHTLELLACINYESLHELTSTLQKLNPSIQADKYQSPTETPCIKLSYIYRNLPYYGINSITLTIIKTKTHILRCLAYIEINPYNALYQCQQPGPYIIDAQQIAAAMKLIQKSLCGLLPPRIISSLTLNRLDFCANLIFPSQVQAEEYIKLLKRGIPPKTLSEFRFLNPTQHRYTAYKESLLLKCASYSFQVYSKYQQMKQKNMKNTNHAIGMVRLELRASKTKLGQLAKKYNTVSPKDDYLQFLTYAPAISKEEIPKTVAKMVGKHNFQGYHDVECKIMDSDYKDSDKEQMLHSIQYFSRHSSSIDFFRKNGLDHKDWRRLIKKFNQIKCSPIPVPRTYSLPSYPGVLKWDAVF